LIQIEGPSLANNIAASFGKAGVPRDQVEEALVWAIGDDFHRIQLKYWPHRLRERIKLDVKDDSKVKDAITLIAEAWKDKDVESVS
jgi:hypothetical protein